jgi:hypothetical protein
VLRAGLPLLIGTPDGVRYVTERHEMGLYTHEQMMAALEAAGLRAAFEPEGLTGRGLYIGSAPED